MKSFCLNTALNANPDKVADMLAHEALGLEAFYMHEAAAYRIGEPDNETTEHTYICQRATDILDLVSFLDKLPATPAMIVYASSVIANHCLDIGDFEKADEMSALGDSYAEVTLLAACEEAKAPSHAATSRSRA